MSSASLTTWALVRIRPLAVTITPEPLLIALRSPGSPNPGEDGSEKNGSNDAGPVSTACDVEMLTTLSTTRSATSGIELSVSTDGEADGAACAGLMPECNAAPAPTSPATAVTARRVRSGVILVPRELRILDRTTGCIYSIPPAARSGGDPRRDLRVHVREPGQGPVQEIPARAAHVWIQVLRPS